MPLHRRHLLVSTLLAPLPASAGDDPAAALRAGGCVVAMRHALAPGTFDPPGFRLGDCSTQRNLNDEGRAQARRIGAWFAARGLQPAAVRSSPWCRCIDTARLAFGDGAEVWPALASPVRDRGPAYQAQLQELRAALGAVPAGRFEVWVTHAFVLSDLAAAATASGEGLVLRAGAGGAVTPIARLPSS